MIHIKHAVTVILLLARLGIAAAQASAADTIPFSLNSQNNICMRVCINRTDSLLLMFHSATTGVTLTREAVKNMSSLHSLQSTQMHSWGGDADTQFSEGNQLRIGRMQWDSLTVFIDEYSGVGTDGKFGYDLFKGNVVEINYDRRCFIVHQRMPRLQAGFWKAPLIEKDGSLYLSGTLETEKTSYRDTFMFHTGYGGAILIDPTIGERYGLQTDLKTISSSKLKDAFGNVFNIDTKQLPYLHLGGKRLKNVPLSFTARPADIPMKVFGNGLMKRFNTVLDFQQQRIYLKPNGNWRQAF